jgi:hypothetical protein
MGTAMLKGNHTPHALTFVPVQPLVDGVGVARLQEPMPGNGVGRLPIRNLEQGCTAFAHVWSSVVITMVQQVLSLRFC